MEKVSCPGHEGKCKFCKSEYGNPQSVGGMPIIDRIYRTPKIDPCCKSCANNLTYKKKKEYAKTSIS